jgi:hypothetical protein
MAHESLHSIKKKNQKSLVLRGLRQGCPLSLYLFILIMEGLSIMMTNSRNDHSISGIKRTKLLSVVHLMFVDDVLILSKVDPREWILIVDLLTLYCSASGLCINTQKSTVHYWGLKDEELASYKDFLPFTFSDLNIGFKYLGYLLKPGPSKSADWSWLVAKFEKKMVS